MSRSQDKVAETESEQANRLTLFGSPPLIDGEDAEAYDELLVRISSAIKPTNIIEDLWVRDFVDLNWEIRRWRRLKTCIMTAKIPEGVDDVLSSILGPIKAMELLRKWAAGEADAINRVRSILDSANVSTEDVMARALMNNLDTMEIIDRIITTFEARRNSILREMHRYRTTANQLRRPIDSVECELANGEQRALT